MSYPFSARSGLIIVEAEISGPAGKGEAKLALDTGATSTSLDSNLLRLLGYDPVASSDIVSIATGTTIERVSRLMINRLSALGRHAIGLRVLAHTLPPEAGLDGLLGLDFFRDLALTIDFRSGRITVS